MSASISPALKQAITDAAEKSFSELAREHPAARAVLHRVLVELSCLQVNEGIDGLGPLLHILREAVQAT